MPSAMPVELLTDLERRVIANLSIPRNALDLEHVLRADPYARVRQDFDMGALLYELAGRGWIVKLGDEHDSPGALVAAMDSHERALDIPDEKAHIFERRLLAPHRNWRAQGVQWVMAKDGFAKLHDPAGIGDPTPLPTADVQRIIAEHFARCYRGEVSDDTRLASHATDPRGVTVMLEDELMEWATAVARAHEEATGEKVALPIAGGAGYSDATELLILDPENGKGTAYTETAPWFMAAVTVAVTDADTGSTITEANYTGYARKSVAAADMNAAAAGSASNANAITFAACTGGASAVIGFAKCVAATVGRLIKYGTCATVNLSATQTPLSFAAGQFTSTLD